MSSPSQYGEDEKQELLRIARTAVREWNYIKRLPPGKPHKQSLLAPAAAFVSLHLGKALRGCIGTTEANQPLYKTVQEMAVAAATRDPRFGPVDDKELERVIFEVSVLHDIEPISGPDEISIGEHGLILDCGSQRGLLLPQVAVAQGWTAPTFLNMVSRKAGLADDDWKRPDAKLSRFQAVVFDEKEYPPVDPMSLLS